MALFDFLKKKKEEPVREEKEKGPWELAYQAQPNVYQGPDGNLLMNFTLTEGTETILPVPHQRPGSQRYPAWLMQPAGKGNHCCSAVLRQYPGTQFLCAGYPGTVCAAAGTQP